MKTTLSRSLGVAAAFLISFLWLPAGAAESQEGVVLYVHSENATNAYLKKLSLPRGQSTGGRFAVVRLIDGAWGEGSFALVWVPEHLSIKPDDRVELLPAEEDPLANPGTGVVARVSPTLARVR